MSEELRPCPFCGNKNIRKNFGIFPELFCSECEATIYAYDEHEDLAKSWNTRPLEDALQSRIAELEAENNRLSVLLHDEISQLEIATDLGNMRWVALNNIYENCEKHNTNWCKRMAMKGLGINNE